MDLTCDRPTSRIDIDADDVGRGFGQLVLALADMLRELMERQAIRRIDAGDLNKDQIEGIGTSLLRIREQITELRAALSRDGSHDVRGDT